jgi:serine protease
LTYHGGTAGIGVTTGLPRVYVIYWGSQWGASSTDAKGNVHLAGDSAGMAPVQQAFLRGVGTGGETYSGVMTQYCEGVSSGTTSCATNTQHVGYPTGGALAGVWEDSAAASPAQATATQLAQEVNKAAAHFGNTTAASNRNVQYVITSPPGTHPDGFNTPGSTWCAWHDHTTDGFLATTSPYGDLAFTNMPYLTDVGVSCGRNFVNAGNAGLLDGVTIVGSHEYAETITDQSPNSDVNGLITSGGWADSSGYENGDKCSWISTGQGAAQNITLSTGSFAVQSTWANDFGGGAGGCELTHPVVTNVSLGAPTALAATAGNGFADVHWQPPTSAPRGPVIEYQVLAAQNGATVAAQLVAGDIRRASLPGLTNGSTYSISVVAIDTSGAGLVPTPVSVTPSATGPAVAVPAAPVGSVKAGDGFVTASWTPSPFDGGAPITAYSVIAVDGGGTVRGWENVGPDVRSASVDGLTNGTSYTVDVLAWNSKGGGALLTATAQPVAGTASKAPVAPLWVVVANGGAGAASVSWGPPPGDGGAPIKAYSVIATQGGKVVGWVNLGPLARTSTVTGLPSGTDVTMYVVATNAKGFGALSAPILFHVS